MNPTLNQITVFNKGDYIWFEPRKTSLKLKTSRRSFFLRFFWGFYKLWIAFIVLNSWELNRMWGPELNSETDEALWRLWTDLKRYMADVSAQSRYLQKTSLSLGLFPIVSLFQSPVPSFWPLKYVYSLHIWQALPDSSNGYLSLSPYYEPDIMLFHMHILILILTR